MIPAQNSVHRDAGNLPPVPSTGKWEAQDQRALADKIRAITVFCLTHCGRCFADFTPPKLFRYVAFHLLNGTCLRAEHTDELKAVAFYQPANAAEIIARDQAGEPQFTWSQTKGCEDSFLIGQVMGRREWFPDIIRQVRAAWPDWAQHRCFTYRWRQGRPRLVELSWQTIQRFGENK